MKRRKGGPPPQGDSTPSERHFDFSSGDAAEQELSYQKAVMEAELADERARAQWEDSREAALHFAELEAGQEEERRQRLLIDPGRGSGSHSAGGLDTVGDALETYEGPSFAQTRGPHLQKGEGMAREGALYSEKKAAKVGN